MSLQLEVLSPDGAAFEGTVDQVVLPAVDGECGILPGHASFMTLIGQGRLSYREGSREGGIRVEGGFALVGPDRVRVLAERAAAEAEATVAPPEGAPPGHS